MKAGTLEIELLTNIARLQADMDKAKGLVGDAMGAVGRAVDAAKSALGGLAGAFALREFVEMADTMKTVSARIKLVTADGEDLARVQSELVRVSQSNMVGIEATAAAYAKLSRPLRSLGADTQTVIDVTDSFGKALRIGGANAEEAAAATLQFGQAMASGVLRGDEFNSIAEASPRVLQAIAEGSGLAEGKLRELAAQGKLTAGVVGGALLREMTALEAEAAQIPQTVAGTFTNFKTDLMLVASDLNKSTDLMAAFSSALNTAAGVVRSFGSASVSTIGAVTRLMRDHKEVVEAVTIAVVALGGAYVGLQAAAGLVTAITALQTAMTALSAATVAARAGFLVMAATMGTLPAIFTVVQTAAVALYASLGPIGWAMAAIGAAGAVLGALYLKHASDADKARAASSSYADEMHRMRVEIEALRRGEEAVQALRKKDGLEEYKKALEAQGRYTKEQVDNLVALKRAEQDARDASAARMEEEGRKRAAQAEADKKAEEARKKAAREAEQLAKKRNDFDAETSGIEKQIAMIHSGMSAEEAKFRVEQEHAGMSLAAIDARWAAQTRLNNAISVEKTLTELIKKDDEDRAKRLEGWAKPLKIDDTKVLEQLEAGWKRSGDAVQRYLNLQADIDLDGVFGNSGKALGAVVNNFDRLVDRQVAHNDAIRAGAMATANWSKISEQHTRLQLNDFGNMTAAAKGFFHEGSSGYKTLQAAETAFRTVELALAIKNAAAKIGLFTGVTAAKVAGDATEAASAGASAAVQVGANAAVGASAAAAGVANQALGDPYTAFARMAAMAAAMAALGFGLSGFGGGGSSHRLATNSGTGTVLGDDSAKSESISKALEQLRDIDTSTMRYSSQMAASLQNIEQSLAGLSSLIVRTGGVDALAKTVQTGTKVTGPLQYSGLGLATQIPVLGGIINSVGKALFGTKTSVSGQGIYAGAQSLGDILGGGFDASYYAEIEKKKKTFGITTSKKFSTTMTGADDELENQFAMVLRGFYDAIGAASVPLGKSLDDIRGQLDGFVVDLGHIDLKGLTGEEIQEKLSAVFGAAGDRMAQAALGGLEQFQKVGENYLQTVVRVASSVEAMSNRFALLGQAANIGVTATMSLVDAFGDVSTALSATDDYFQSYYTDAERSAAKTKQLQDVIEGLGLAMPDSTAAFRALVDAQDLTSDAGRQAYVSLMKLAPAFADVFGSAQDAADAASAAAEAAAQQAEEAAQAEAQRLAAIADERAGLQRQLLEAQGETAALRQLDLAALDASNRGLQLNIWALQDQQAAQDAATKASQDAAAAAQKIADDAAAAETARLNERAGLQRQLLEAQGDTAALRALDLAALDASNRALQQQIWALQDQQAAQEAATNAAQELRDAWTSIADSLLDAAKKIRGEGLSSSDSYAALLSQFNNATGAARAGDKDAAGSLSGLSDTLLAAAESVAQSREDLARIQGMVAGSLEQTASLIGGGTASSSGLSAALSAAAGSAGEPAWWQSFINGQVAGTQSAANDSQTVIEIRRLRTEVEGMREEQRTGDAAIAAGVGRTYKALERASPDGDAFAVRTLDGDALSTRAVA